MGNQDLDQAVVVHGRELVKDGSLRRLREEVGISVNVQAHMIGVQPVRLSDWERGRSAPSPRSAVKISKWYISTESHPSRNNLPEGGFTDLIHVSMASQYLGMSYGTVVDWCQRRLIRCHDLGPLGLFVPRDEVTSLSKTGSTL